MRKEYLNFKKACIVFLGLPVCFILFITSCAAGPDVTAGINVIKPGIVSQEMQKSGFINLSAEGDLSITSELDRIAELERSGSFFPGLGFYESTIREAAGDYIGTVIAAYKELSWAYSHASISREQVEEALVSAFAYLNDQMKVFTETDLSPGTSPGFFELDGGLAAARGCIAFFREDWEEAWNQLSNINLQNDDPDSFLNWMIFVASFELRGSRESGAMDSSGNRSAYSAIRARYVQFPEYWYRGARVFSFIQDDNIAAVFAEQCINLSPNGPFADESRRILAAHLGLNTESNSWQNILTLAEIEDIIYRAVYEDNPEVLAELFPMLTLPDNPYIFFSLGALSSIAANPEFHSYLSRQAQINSSLLRERLLFAIRS